MSDRLAVFNRGPDRAGRHPGRRLRAARDGVRGRASSARRTCSAARRPATIVGSDGHVHGAPGEDPPRRARTTPVGADEIVAPPGSIREVVYLGSDTRYIVALDAGGELVVTQQNLATSSMEALAHRARLSGSSGSGSTTSPSRTDGRIGGGACARDRCSAALAVVGLVASACSSAATPSPARRPPRHPRPRGPGASRVGGRQRRPAPASPAGPSLPTSIGAGEGELNIIVWAGYAEDGSNEKDYDWVHPFEAATGCKVNAKTGRHLGRDGHAHAPGRRHRLRRRVGLRRRLEPAHRQRRRRADQPDLIPDCKDIAPFLQSPGRTTPSTASTTASPHGWGGNIAHVPHGPVQPGADELGRGLRPGQDWPPTRARSPTTTARSTSPTRRSTSRPTSPTSGSPIRTS